MSRLTATGCYELTEQNNSSREFEVTAGENDEVWIIAHPLPIISRQPTLSITGYRQYTAQPMNDFERGVCLMASHQIRADKVMSVQPISS
ncbi:MAG: hypothetical protein BMS9Abin02_0784 [Anaerolineae bacterium]|nr:MAG: hypothetical protein BMS9Abin02_0784 [Anaerolineae bacterium]